MNRVAILVRVHRVIAASIARQMSTNAQPISAPTNRNASMASLAVPSQDQQLIARHYGNRVDGGRENRERSTIIQLRKLNNWTKSVLIDMFCRPKSSVLDIGGGKGGDLNNDHDFYFSFYAGPGSGYQSKKAWETFFLMFAQLLSTPTSLCKSKF